MTTPGPASSRIHMRRSPRNLWKDRRPQENTPVFNPNDYPFNKDLAKSKKEQEMAILSSSKLGLEGTNWNALRSDETVNKTISGTVVVNDGVRTLLSTPPSSPHGKGPRWTPASQQDNDSENASTVTESEIDSETEDRQKEINSDTEVSDTEESVVSDDDNFVTPTMVHEDNDNQLSVIDIAMGVMLLNHLFSLMPQTYILTVERIAGSALLACTVNLGAQLASSGETYRNGKWHLGALAIMTLCKLRNSFH